MNVNEVFLSHSSIDGNFAEKLARTLRAHGLPVWLSTTEILGAQQWHDEIGRALNRCDWFVVLLSPHSVRSMWVKRELLYALREGRFERRIVPVMLADCDYNLLSWILGSIEFVQMTRSFDEGIRNLLRIWGIGFRPELSAFVS